MSKKHHKCPFAFGTFIKKDLLTSRAFISLEKHGKTVLLFFLLKREMPGNKKIPKHMSKDSVLNNGDLILSYPEMNSLGLHNEQARRGIKEVIEKGFIEITYQGGKCKSDYSQYKLIDDWRDYEKPNFTPRTKNKTTGYGFCANGFKKQK